MATALAGAALAGVLLATLVPTPAPRAAASPGIAPRAPALTLHGPRFGAPPTASSPAARPFDLDREIARLGDRAAVPREPLRERYLAADDLHAFMRELLPDAEAGERVAQFYLYLALGQCQTWLRLDAGEARALEDRMALLLGERPAGERQQWQDEVRRCRGFAGADLGPLRAAMGADLPGAESEYASIWFQRAAQAGYPPALAEGALRISTLDVFERLAMLEEAVAGGDPEVYWMLSYHSPGEAPGGASVAGVAWLIAACRAGYDCSPDARWFRASACLQEGEDCESGESAVEHFWYGLPAHERESAWRLAARIERDRAAGRYDRLPWPDLGRRNIVEMRLAEGLATH